MFSFQDPKTQHDMTYAWNNVILPRQLGHSKIGYERVFSYEIRHLNKETEYEAQVQAKNKFGWSERSDSIKFRTVLNRSTGN